MPSRMTPPSRRGDDLVLRGSPTRATATVMPLRRRGRRTTTTTTTASRNSPLFVTLAVFAASSLLAFQSLHRAAAQPAGNDSAEQYCEDATSALQFYQNQMLTWDSVYATAFIAFCFGSVCLLGYETLRRDPLIGKYIYDRKRLSQPDRSPPPLMTSRSLWRGGRDEGRRCPAGCWPVCPALFEILFMSLDPNYVRYSRRADEARKMREMRGHHGCCGTGWINRSLLNNYRGRRSSSSVDEDGYEFYPDYNREYSHAFHGDDARYSVERNEDPVKDDGSDGFGEFLMVVSGTSSSPKDRVNEDEEGEEKAATTTSVIRKTAFDLFPEEDLRQYFAQSRYNRGGVGGTRDLIKNIMDGGCKLTESEPNKDASSERGSGVKDDTKDEESTPPHACDADGRNLTVDTTGVIDGIDEDEVKYPSRLKYVFTLLPFYNWRSTFKKIGVFLLLPAFLQSCRYVLSRMRQSPRGSRRGDEFGRLDTSKGVLVTAPGKDLSPEDKELLRCAGLDMYLHIRFARFGFDATFYPFLVGLVFVLPVYNVMNQYQSIPAENAPKYLGLTINNIHDGSKAIVWIVLLTIFLYLYIMRRLWIEWEVFLKLRHEFLARGGVHFFKDVRPTYLRKDVFESLFPGEIEHAEMLIDTSNLEGILQKRRALIEKYENNDAKYQYERWLRKKRESGQEPARPMVKIGGIFSGKKQDALEYYNSKIIELEELASKEYDEIVETRMKCHTISQIKSSGHGEEQDFFHGTGVVTFNSIAGKQSGMFRDVSCKPVQ
ncbi:hypothetical protein ACHAW5_007854 [Stephanodiscus triporus]|uniref:PARP n=1 Tax=Stephanodiscus triporus TaxID=2934178 RepID=A0ABD3PQL9_9STRA